MQGQHVRNWHGCKDSRDKRVAARQPERLDVIVVVLDMILLCIAVDERNHLVELQDALGDDSEPHGTHLYLYLSFLFLHTFKLFNVALKLADSPSVDIR